MWDYIFEKPIKTLDNKVVIGNTVKENNVYYSTKYRVDEELKKVLTEVGADYFGFDYAEVNMVTAHLNKSFNRVRGENLIQWKETIIEPHDDYTVHYNPTSTVLGSKYFKGELYLRGARPADVIRLIKNNLDVLEGRHANGNHIIINDLKTDRKEISTLLVFEKTPHLLRVPYAEGVYNVPLTYEEKNLKAIIESFHKPAIKGARKVFGPPNGTPLDKVKSIRGGMKQIEYIFKDNTFVRITPNGEVSFVYRNTITTEKMKNVREILHLVFEAGTVLILEIL